MLPQSADLFRLSYQHRVGGLSLVLPLPDICLSPPSALCLGAPHPDWVPGRGLLWGQLTIAVPWMTTNTEPPHSQDISRAMLPLGCGSHETVKLQPESSDHEAEPPVATLPRSRGYSKSFANPTDWRLRARNKEERKKKKPQKTSLPWVALLTQALHWDRANFH